MEDGQLLVQSQQLVDLLKLLILHLVGDQGLEPRTSCL